MTFNELISILNDLAWGPWMLILLVGTGIYLSYKVGFIQFSKFPTVMKNTIGKIFEKHESGEGEITPFQALTTALAATVGTGNIAGVTGAITIGGPGAVFWMWISACFGMITKYGEVVLAVKYRERNAKGEWVGGPMYYIKNGLGKKYHWLAVVFCLLAGIAAFGIGNMTQINTIASSINSFIASYGINPSSYSFVLLNQVIPYSSLAIGIIIAALVALVLFGGLKRIGSVAEKIVPFMAMVYIAAILIILGMNITILDDIFLMILEGAFNAEAVLGGAFGITLLSTIRNGVGRGIFSNEAGLGSAPIAHASTSETDPVKQGFYGIFEVFADTLIICTLTAFTLLCGYFHGVNINWGHGAGAELISQSFSTVFGSHIGSFIVAVCITLFALSTILSWALYGTRCCEFLFGTKSIKVYQFFFVIFVVIGACLQLDLVWLIADTLNGFMALPNLVALLGLSGVIIQATKEYFQKQ